MSEADREKDQTNEYTSRIMVAALTKCRDEDEAAKLIGLHFILATEIDRVKDQAGELLEGKQYEQAIAVLDGMIGRAEELARPYSVEAVREVLAYSMVSLYFQRAIARFGAASGTSDLEAALADLDRAQRYPTSTFADLDPEKLAGMRLLRTTIEAMLEGPKQSDAKQRMPPKAGIGVGPSTALWWGTVFGLGMVLSLSLLAAIFSYHAITIIILVMPLLALTLLIAISRLAFGRPFPFQPKPFLALYALGVVLGMVGQPGRFPGGLVGMILLIVLGTSLGIWWIEAKTRIFSGLS